MGHLRFVVKQFSLFLYGCGEDAHWNHLKQVIIHNHNIFVGLEKLVSISHNAVSRSDRTKSQKGNIFLYLFSNLSAHSQCPHNQGRDKLDTQTYAAAYSNVAI